MPYYHSVSEETLEHTQAERQKKGHVGVFVLQLSLWAVPELLSASVLGPEIQVLGRDPRNHVVVTSKVKGQV